VFARKHFTYCRAIYGTSTGALIATKLGAYLVTKNTKHLKELNEIYLQVKTKDVLESRFFFDRWTGSTNVERSAISALFHGDLSIFSAKPLFRLVDKLLPEKDIKQILAAGRGDSAIDISFVAVDMQTGSSFVISNTDPKITPRIFRAGLLASSCNPVFMPPVDVDGRPVCLDGGLRSVNPLEWVFKSKLFDDFEEIIAISTDSVNIGFQYQFTSILDVALRSIHLLNANTIEGDLQLPVFMNWLAKLRTFITQEQWQEFTSWIGNPTLDEKLPSRPIPIYNIRPEFELDETSALEFDPAVAIKWFRQGLAQGLS